MTVLERPPVRERASTPRWRTEDAYISWGASIAVAVLALALRLYHLGSPREFQFDETYYAKDAWSLANHGYVRSSVEEANDQILAGQTTGIWEEAPSMIVHPEAGKWLIAVGEKAFGMDPFGWRIAAAVVGALMVLVMCRLARRLTGSTFLACVAGLLLTFDGLHFVLSRLALLDIFLAFFTLLAVTCLVCDRDWYRARLARLQPADVRRGWGPVRGLLFRPWLLAAGIAFGLAIGTKWTAVYPLAAFGVLVWLWSASARRSVGVDRAVLRSALVDGVPAFAHLVLVALVVYVGTWAGWLVHAGEYEESLSSTQYTRFVEEGATCDDEPILGDQQWSTASEPDASGIREASQSLRSLWYYHQDLYTFHTHFLNCSDHTYASKPSGWLFLNRPVGVAADTDIQPGTRGCDAPEGSDCLRQVLLIGTPILWWAGVAALFYALAMWVGGRDWRFGFALVGVGSTWLPWLLYDDRPIFLFYMIVTLPFIVLTLTMAMGKLIGTSREPSARRTAGVVVAGAFFVLVLVNFAWFWPIFTNELLTKSQWLDRVWFSDWI